MLNKIDLRLRLILFAGDATKNINYFSEEVYVVTRCHISI